MYDLYGRRQSSGYQLEIGYSNNQNRTLRGTPSLKRPCTGFLKETRATGRRRRKFESNRPLYTLLPQSTFFQPFYRIGRYKTRPTYSD